MMCANCDAVESATVLCPHGFPMDYTYEIYAVDKEGEPCKLNLCTCCGYYITKPKVTGSLCTGCATVERVR